MEISPCYIKTITVDGTEYQKELELREEVLRKPFGLSLYNEDLSREGEHAHFAAYADGDYIGCLILTPLEGGAAKMRQVAVKPEYQRQGVGKALVSASEEYALEKGLCKIVLHARTVAVPFYEKLGYAAEGGEFLEIRI